MNTFTITTVSGDVFDIQHTCTYYLRDRDRIRYIAAANSRDYLNNYNEEDIAKVVYSTKNFAWDTEDLRLAFQRLLMLSVCAPYYTVTDDGYVEYELSLGSHYARDLMCVSFIRLAEERRAQVKKLFDIKGDKAVNATALLASIPFLGDGYSYQGHAMLQPFNMFKGQLKVGGLGWLALQHALKEEGLDDVSTVSERVLVRKEGNGYTEKYYGSAPWEWFTKGDR